MPPSLERFVTGWNRWHREPADGGHVSIAAGGIAGQARGRPGRAVRPRTLVLSAVAPAGGCQCRRRKHGALSRRDRRRGRGLAGLTSRGPAARLAELGWRVAEPVSPYYGQRACPAVMAASRSLPPFRPAR